MIAITRRYTRPLAMRCCEQECTAASVGARGASVLVRAAASPALRLIDIRQNSGRLLDSRLTRCLSAERTGVGQHGATSLPFGNFFWLTQQCTGTAVSDCQSIPDRLRRRDARPDIPPGRQLSQPVIIVRASNRHRRVGDRMLDFVSSRLRKAICDRGQFHGGALWPGCVIL